jgi:serine/threonine protein kinase
MDTKPPDHHHNAAAQPEDMLRCIGDYELREEIARGRTAVVYKAYQVSLKRYVALKIPHASLFASPEEARRFWREAEAAAHLEHPHIVRLLEVGELDLYFGRPGMRHRGGIKSSSGL